MFGLAGDSADGAPPPPAARLPDGVEAAIAEGEAEATVVVEGVAGVDGSTGGAERGGTEGTRSGGCAGGAGGADGAGSAGAGGAAGGAGGGCGSQVRGQCQASESWHAAKAAAVDNVRSGCASGFGLYGRHCA